jgi:phosphoribosylanthranilate isomerase
MPSSVSVTLLKICGLRDPAQAVAIAALGVDAIGVIGVPASPRFLPAPQRAGLFTALRQSHPRCRGVVVLADPTDELLAAPEALTGARVVQLHGRESPERCARIRARSGLEVWKALRIRRPEDLAQVEVFGPVVDAVLLDAWAPDRLGGTGRRLPLEWLKDFTPPLPWWLAGGVSPEGAAELIERLDPRGLDASSGVELAPGVKDLARVRALVEAVRGAGRR